MKVLKELEALEAGLRAPILRYADLVNAQKEARVLIRMTDEMRQVEEEIRVYQLIMADWFADHGNTSMENACRWSAAKNKWPLITHEDDLLFMWMDGEDAREWIRHRQLQRDVFEEIYKHDVDRQHYENPLRAGMVLLASSLDELGIRHDSPDQTISS